ncbi:hypothetical protein ACSBR1_041454 [Camellia fascicularis]
MDKEEDDADKDARNDDVDVQGEVEKTQWVDMEVKGLMQDGHCNSPTVSIVDETTTELENQKAAEGGVGSKTSMQSKLLQCQVVRNCRVIGEFESTGLMRSITDNGIIRPNIKLEVVLNQAQFEGICNGLGMGLVRQNMVDPGPLTLEPPFYQVSKGQLNGLIEAHDNSSFEQQI